MRTDLLKVFAQESRGKILERVLKERFCLDVSGIRFPMNHKLFEVFDTKIQQLLANGLVEHFVSESYEALNPKYELYLRHKTLNEPENPKVLTLEHLEAGFVIWLLSICFAVFAFAVEWIVRLSELFVWRRIFFELNQLRQANVISNMSSKI